MSMLTRTGTVIRKDRRRSITKYSRDRRGSAPVILSQNYMGCPGKVGLTRTAALRLDRDLKRLARAASPARCVDTKTDMSWFEEDDIDPKVLLKANLSIHNLTNQQTPNNKFSSSSPLRENLCLEKSNDNLGHMNKLEPVLQQNFLNQRDYQDLLKKCQIAEPDSERAVDDASSSLVSAIQEANLDSIGSWHFVKKAFGIISNTITFTVFLALFLTIPCAMLSVGAKYIEECPVEPKIPVFLIVGGCVGFAKFSLTLWRQIRIKRHGIATGSSMTYEDPRGLSAMYNITSVAVSFFLGVWFVFGNIWVLGNWQPNYRPLLHDPLNWCSKTAYLFAFWVLMLCYIALFLTSVLILTLVTCHAFVVHIRNQQSFIV